MGLIAVLVICALFAICTLKIRTRAVASKSIPPGSKFRFPILGHLPILGAEPWVTFTQWKKIYGPMFAIKMGIFDVIVLNESKLIKEAYGRPEFNGRPPIELYKAPSDGKGLAFNDGPLCAEQKAFVVANPRFKTYKAHPL